MFIECQLYSNYCPKCWVYSRGSTRFLIPQNFSLIRKKELRVLTNHELTVSHQGTVPTRADKLSPDFSCARRGAFRGHFRMSLLLSYAAKQTSRA